MEIRAAQGFFHDADIFHHFGKFFRFHGERAVGAAVAAAQRQMLFHHFYAESNGAGCHRGSHAVIRQAHNAVKHIAQRWNHVQVNIFIGRGIGRNTFHQNHIFVSFFPADAERTFNILQMGDARGKNHRLMQAGDFAYQGNVVDFVGSQLIGGHIHGFHKINSRKIKGRGEAFHSQAVRLFHQLRLPIPGSVSLFVKFIKGGTVPDSSLCYLKTGCLAVQGDGFRLVGLKLHGIGAGLFGGMDDFHRPAVILQVIGGHLRHDKNGSVISHGVGTYGKLFIHGNPFLRYNFFA